MNKMLTHDEIETHLRGIIKERPVVWSKSLNAPFRRRINAVSQEHKRVILDAYDTLEMRPEPEQDEQLCVCDTMSISTSEETMDVLRFRISTKAIEEMLISEDLILINGEVAAPDEVVAFLKRLAKRNAREQSNG